MLAGYLGIRTSNPSSRKQKCTHDYSVAHVAAIEHEILPKMIIAGFAAVTITSVVVTSIIAGRIGTG
jgi:hypothetical protein